MKTNEKCERSMGLTFIASNGQSEQEGVRRKNPWLRGAILSQLIPVALMRLGTPRIYTFVIMYFAWLWFRQCLCCCAVIGDSWLVICDGTEGWSGVMLSELLWRRYSLLTQVMRLWNVEADWYRGKVGWWTAVPEVTRCCWDSVVAFRLRSFLFTLCLCKKDNNKNVNARIMDAVKKKLLEICVVVLWCCDRQWLLVVVAASDGGAASGSRSLKNCWFDMYKICDSLLLCTRFK